MGQGTLTVEAVAPNDDRPASTGRINFIDNAVDPTTGTIKVKGTFPNSDRRLWPGQFVNVKVTLTSDPRAVVVPSNAVQAGQQGTFVFVVKQDQTGRAPPVTVARTRGDESVMKSGVQPGETVVTGRSDSSRARQPRQHQVGPRRSRAKGGVMNLSEIFIKRPVTTTLIVIGIMVFGVMSYRLLPVSDLPAIDFPTIQVGAACRARVPKRWRPPWRCRSKSSSRRSPA
jgi:hypothetical protein